MKSESLNQIFAYLDKSFDEKRTQLMHIETCIKEIIGDNMDDCLWQTHERESLDILLHQRMLLLDSMFTLTYHSYNRMMEVNQQLNEMSIKLLNKMISICKGLACSGRDFDFDDDIEVEGTLDFCYTDTEHSIVLLEDDMIYGSDFALMIAAQDLIKDFRFGLKHIVDIGMRYDKPETWSMYNNLIIGDGNSWTHELADDFDGINICHSTAALSSYLHYPTIDILHMNDFVCEVNIKHQHFSNK